MDLALKSIIEAIHSTPYRASLVISGGASNAVGWLLSIPGASSTITDISIPYSRRSMAQLLEKIPPNYCSMKTAQDLSLRAYHKAFSHSPPDAPVIGIGCTCSLTSLSNKKGEHRCFVAARVQEKLFEYSLILKKGVRDRFEEDYISSRLLIQAMSDACEMNASVDMYLDRECENLNQGISNYAEEELIQQILDKKINVLMFRGNVSEFSKKYIKSESGENENKNENKNNNENKSILSHEKRRILLSGSFNPLHDGHINLLYSALNKVNNGYPVFELSIFNADKPPLSKQEIGKRLHQFKCKQLNFALTNAPLFVEKSKIFNDSTFVVGYDTAIRLIDPKYYGGSFDKMVEELTEIRKNGCDFVVGGRVTSNGFKTIEDVPLPEEIEDMFHCISEHEFRMDISSTQIRKSLNAI